MARAPVCDHGLSKKDLYTTGATADCLCGWTHRKLHVRAVRHADVRTDIVRPGTLGNELVHEARDLQPEGHVDAGAWKHKQSVRAGLDIARERGGCGLTEALPDILPFDLSQKRGQKVSEK